MIRQDESSRRASALLFLDTRATALGQVHSPGLERAVSARHYGGFGLGLWIARQIVEASGGRIAGAI